MYVFIFLMPHVNFVLNFVAKEEILGLMKASQYNIFQLDFIYSSVFTSAVVLNL